MQIKKERVRNRMLSVAKDDFLALGFQKASLRDIAKKAEVTKGCIYTYFKSKDDMFGVLVNKAYELFSQSYQFEGNDFEEMYSQEVSLQSFENHIHLINQYRDELILLLFRSEGSSYSNFKEKIVKAYEENTFRLYQYFYNKANIEYKATSLFVHTLAKLYITFVEEVLLHDPSDHEIKQYVYEMNRFLSIGIKEVLLLNE